MERNAVGAVGLAAGLVGWSITAGSRIPGRRHPLVQAALGIGLIALTRTPLGLRPPALWCGVRTGLAAGSVVVVAVTSSTALPAVRAVMANQEVPVSAATWLAVRIPLGTVWPEEASYRSALGTVAADAFGPRSGRLVQAAAFGLSHIYDARAAGESVFGIVLATGIAGWFFGRLFEHSGSLAAPMLAHLAINETAAVVALVVRDRRVKRRGVARKSPDNG